MDDKKSVLTNLPAILAATGGLITAVIGLMTFMSTPAPTVTAFDATPNIIGMGESSMLKWAVTGDGAAVTIEPDIGVVALSGSREVSPANTTSYVLTAKKKDQVTTATVQLVVEERSPESANSTIPAGSSAREVSPKEDSTETGASEAKPVQSDIAEVSSSFKTDAVNAKSKLVESDLTEVSSTSASNSASSKSSSSKSVESDLTEVSSSSASTAGLTSSPVSNSSVENSTAGQKSEPVGDVA